MRFLYSEDEWDPRIERGPAEPYRLPQSVLSLPINALELTVRTLAEYRRLEACCFWYGTRKEDEAQVEIVVIPAQLNQRGNYHVSADSVSLMSDSTRKLDLVCLAQIHSHPGNWVGHSAYDDEHTTSQRVLSIVFPNYGHWRSEWPHGVGVHENQGGYWHLLTDVDARSRVRVVQLSLPTNSIDLRHGY